MATGEKRERYKRQMPRKPLEKLSRIEIREQVVYQLTLEKLNIEQVKRKFIERQGISIKTQTKTRERKPKFNIIRSIPFIGMAMS